MTSLRTPMRWPNTWRDPSLLSMLQGTAIDCLLIPGGSEFAAVRSRAQEAGFQIADPDAPQAGIRVVKGEWTGVKMSRSGGVEAGPTGVPWVDSNGWAILLESALHPGTQVWIDAPPAADAAVPADAYLIAIADSAARGGRWIISLDSALAAALAAGKPEAQKPWNRVKETAAFFAAHPEWPPYTPVAAIGVVSDFSGKNEFFTRELLNLLDRAGQPARALVKDKLGTAADGSTQGLKALVYVDAEPPSAALRRQAMQFVQSGGLLIASSWPEPPDEATSSPLDRFLVTGLGKGKVALAKDPTQDPYVLAGDCVVLLSHRHDLVRIWNGGATGFAYTKAPDGKTAAVHLLFYSARGPDDATVWVSGKYRSATAATVESARATDLEIVQRGDGSEVHLPRVSQYVALELVV